MHRFPLRCPPAPYRPAAPDRGPLWRCNRRLPQRLSQNCIGAASDRLFALLQPGGAITHLPPEDGHMEVNLPSIGAAQEILLFHPDPSIPAGIHLQIHQGNSGQGRVLRLLLRPLLPGQIQVPLRRLMAVAGQSPFIIQEPVILVSEISRTRGSSVSSTCP